MTTDRMEKTDVQTPTESSWYVGLAQLPGLPVKLRLEVLAIVTATLQQMPVFSCRNHFWSGGPRGSACASEDNDGSDPLSAGHPDLEESEDQVPELTVGTAVMQESIDVHEDASLS
jgi:hypothetical protein